MAKVNNIQVLFDSIRFPQVDRYMLGRGFKILNPADQDSRIYQIDHDQEEHQIRLPIIFWWFDLFRFGCLHGGDLKSMPFENR